ncbi:MAG: error-prone DNA polymerase [Polyangiaceae bacterium]|nr:error-prone DNA polymerase [Polyangiaceae bacterium]
MKSNVRFAELLGRTSFSFLEGASKPDELVRASKERGLEAIGICDRDGLYGIARAHGEAKRIGHKIITGAELSIEEPGILLTDISATDRRITLLAVDLDGYSNLCRLLTAAHAHHEKGIAGITVNEIASIPQGLFALIPSEEHVTQDAILGPITDAFGERALVYTWRHADTRDGDRTQIAKDAEERFGTRIIATNRPIMHASGRKRLADVLACIRHKTTLAEAGTRLLPNAEAILRSPAEMAAIFRDQLSWVERTVEIAQECLFSPSDLSYQFPSDDLKRPGETAIMALRRLVEEGCKRRYGANKTPEHVQHLIEKELALIEKLQKAEYFLSAHQVVEMARSRKILCQGRGSAANSAVCFVLGVTSVDPARSNLLFERFLSEERNEPPDIDVDFEHERREEVIQAIYDTYGRDRAAMVSEVISYRGRSALREVGKVMGLSLDQLDRLSGLAGYGGVDPKNPHHLADVGLDPNDRRLQLVLELADEIQGFPRHLSIHVGGFVLSAGSLDRIAPIEPARMEARTVIPWDKDDLDELGFFKVDVLGLGMLTAIRKSLEFVHLEKHGDLNTFDPIEAMAQIPSEDTKVYDAICAADTIGVFQIESRAQMSMLPRLKPREFYDLVVEVAIVRPGPIQGGMVHPYLRRREGKENRNPPHPSLAPILDRTLGVPLFQEQVMQIAMVGANYTPGEADQLRRDMAAWRRHGRLERHREKLLSGFRKNGISQEFAEALYKQVQGFGEYGFPESHAASFALLVYVSAWLKVYYPAEFACALLNSQPMGFYSASSIIQDAQRHGVTIYPVCVLESRWDNVKLMGESAFRLGFRQVKGVSENAGRAIESAREQGPFTSVQDFVIRTNLPRDEVNALAEAGAFDAISPQRREAMWRAQGPKGDGLFQHLALEKETLVGLPDLSATEQLTLDYEKTGLSVADHPMKHMRAALNKQRVKRAEDLKSMSAGTRVRVAGLVIGRQRPETASGVTFMTLEDETGMINLIVHKKVFDAQFQVARHSSMVMVSGKIERAGDVIHVLARQFERISLPSGEHIEPVARNFH